MSINSKEIWDELAKFINLPPKCVSVTIHLTVNGPAKVVCTYFPEKDFESVKGGPVTKQFELVEKKQ